MDNNKEKKSELAKKMPNFLKMSDTNRFNYRQYQRAEKAHATNPATSFSKAEAKSIHRHNSNR